MSLSALGWSDVLARHFGALDVPDLFPARVIRQERARSFVNTGTRTYEALLTGRLQFGDSNERPVVGDWVAIQLLDDDQAVVHAVLPRTGAFGRSEAGARTHQQILAAHVDLALLVCGLDGDFNVRRLERYLVQAHAAGTRPVVVLNKTDLCPDVGPYVRAAESAAPGVDIVALSAVTASGLEALQSYLVPGRTCVVLGSSGVGKSTLVNRLLGEEAQSTAPVRAGDDRGRHTTTHRELFILPGGALLIDTPGLRELQLWADDADLRAAFPDVEALAARCRFRDCGHDTEPGCAVRAAVDAGCFDAGRLASYQKLVAELAYLDRRHDEAGRLDAKRRDKQIAKLQRRFNRDHPKRGG